jgi:hypothetical protein
MGGTERRRQGPSYADGVDRHVRWSAKKSLDSRLDRFGRAFNGGNTEPLDKVPTLRRQFGDNNAIDADHLQREEVELADGASAKDHDHVVGLCARPTHGVNGHGERIDEAATFDRHRRR